MNVLEWRSAIRDDHTLSPTAKLVAVMLSTRADGAGDNVFPSRRRLALDCGFAR